MIAQLEWDQELVYSFYLRPDVPIHANGLGHLHNELAQLRRVPRHPHHWYCSYCRFVCGYLPKLADILWKRKVENAETIIHLLQKSTIDTRRADPKAESEGSERRRSMELYKRNQFTVRSNRYYALSSRNAWGVVKAPPRVSNRKSK